MNYWLIKSEPDCYSFDDLTRDKKTFWDGVRNFQARNNIRQMKIGDELLFYHSNVGKEIVGVAKVVKEAYPDPTAKGDDWSVVDVKPSKKFTTPVTLADIKAIPALSKMAFLKQSQLSVSPVTKTEFEYIVRKGNQ